VSNLLENLSKPISETMPSGEDITMLDPAILQNVEWVKKYKG